MYTRASASDYDDWETVHGNAGWGSADLLPLLKKVSVLVILPDDRNWLKCGSKTEEYQCKANEPTHGYGGPLKVSYGGIYTNVGKQFLEVAANYDKSRSYSDDANDLYSCNVYAVGIDTPCSRPCS
jgi:alcohol oxidase